MKKLQNLIKLSSNVKILVPSTVSVDKSLDDSEFNSEVDKALTFMGKLFGGSTASNALGTWVSDDLGLVREKVKVVESYTTSDDLESHIDSVVDYALSLKSRLQQEAIGLIVNNELYFVYIRSGTFGSYCCQSINLNQEIICEKLQKILQEHLSMVRKKP